MNVVHREKRTDNNKTQSKYKNEFVKKDLTDIRGSTSLLPTFSRRTLVNNAPRYQFNEPTASKTSSMGPPLGPPKSAKRRLTTTSSSRLESSSSGRTQPRILASDSAALVDTSHDFCTPRNRPTTLRYISSSSRGGHSGTRSARSTSTSIIEASVILAISEGRGMARGEIGIAAVDLRHPHLVLCQFSDTLLYTHTLTKINYFNPVEVIVPHTFCEGVKPSQLYQLIRDQYPTLNLTTVQRRHFNDAVGRQQIQTLCAPQYSAVYLQVLQKFYALTAAAAVLKYVEYIQCVVFARESLKIEYNSSENTMIIDVGTATQLELVQPLVPSAGSTCCLLGVLGPTYTIGGIRALRAAILQPSCNNEFIENRLDAVQDLIENDAGLMTSLQDVIKKLSDVDKILLLCMESQNQNIDKFGEAQLNQTLLLKTTMELVPKLVEALSEANSGRLKGIKMDFENPNYNQIAEHIRSVIHEDAHLEKGTMGSMQRCFAVKPNINGLLDVARRTYSELIEDIQKMVEQFSEVYDLPLRLNQNVLKGFHIVMPVAPKNRRSFDVEGLPSVFIQVHYSGASVTMSTEELVVLDQQAKESLNEIQKMSNIVISGLLKELRPFMSSLYKLCENVAELDILLALAQASTIGSYIRPSFSNYLDIKNSIHPLLDYNSQIMPVPNDVFASPEYNFTIITGPNMGGKSIYIKQIAVLQIMAQLGCFLPATNAVLRLCDRLFSRIGFNDSVELNASTFVFEMKEIQHILKGLTKSSLVIIDELCRGTSTEEGTGIAWAICEELVMSDAFTFFTTHFMYLTKLQELYFNVVNRHTLVTEEDIKYSEHPKKRLIYQHKVELGTTKIKHYGLALAAKTNMPENTVKLAGELAELIAKKEQIQEATTPHINDERILYELNAKLRHESRKNFNSNDTIKEMLRQFREDYPQLMERIRVQKSRSNLRMDSNVIYSSSNTTGQSQAFTKQHVGNSDHQSSVIDPTPPRSMHFDNQSKNDNDNKRSEIENVNTGSDIENSYTYLLSNVQAQTAYTASEDDAHHPRQNDEATTVKSSTELLTTFMTMNNNNDREMQLDDSQANNSHNLNNENLSLDEAGVSTKDISNISDVNNNSTVYKSNENINSTNNSDSNDSECMLLGDGSSDNESDLADALTQIIDEYSKEENNYRKSDEEMSVDEELAMETVNEIHEDLQSGVSIDDVILTPPFDFRD